MSEKKQVIEQCKDDATRAKLRLMEIIDKLYSVGAGGGVFRAFAYTFNATYPDYSEFGDVLVQSAFGGVRRVA